ncbi:MAG TPA: AAA family ATPase [Bacillales bacterium]|nr:AAA family ATPase [Bacillales bacterium]
MKKIQLVLADPDPAYVESVAAYIRTSDEESRFHLKLFTEKSRLHDYLHNQPFIDILIISPQMLSDPSEPHPTDLTIVLEDERILEYQADFPSVFKYQPLNQLLSEVLSIYYEKRGRVKDIGNNKRKTSVMAVYSATGGVGKTTLAVNLCKQLALSGQKVFYLNLELLHSTSLFFSSAETHHSSRILYYLKAIPDQLISKVESLKKYDPYLKVDYFDLPVNPEEMRDLTEKDTETLIASLIETEHYDSIIIDLDSSVEERCRASIKQSDRIFWLLNNDLQSFHKTSFLLDTCDPIFGEKVDVNKKATLILNKHTGQQQPPDHVSHFNLPIQHFLPYIPEWKNVYQGSRILTSAIFSDELIPLVNTSTNALGGGEHG